MDIASRLRQYMTENNIASSQFADNADIPRPTLSQLLNGRNKKISNELIEKIHVAYPSLNVMWLMFGEGPMETAANMQTSERQNPAINAIAEAKGPRYEAVYVAQAPDYANMERREKRPNEVAQAHTMAKPTNESPISAETMQALSNAGVRMTDGVRVQQIMVLYTDGRFESFRPSDQ